MNRFKRYPVLFLFIFSFSCSVGNKQPIPADEQYVVMLSMDGFRWDYASRVETSWMDYIPSKGVKAAYSKPALPTKTFPNHYCMATGLCCMLLLPMV